MNQVAFWMHLSNNYEKFLDVYNPFLQITSGFICLEIIKLILHNWILEKLQLYLLNVFLFDFSKEILSFIFHFYLPYKSRQLTPDNKGYENKNIQWYNSNTLLIKKLRPVKIK